MDDQQKERWLELAEAASKEQDYKKLIAILKKLNRALDEREAQLRKQKSTT